MAEATKATGMLGSDSRGLALIGQLFAAIVLLVAVTTRAGWNVAHPKNWAYTIAAASVAMFFSLVGLGLIAAGKSEQRLFEMPVAGTVTVGRLLAFWNFVWWAVAAGICTFDAPFTSVENGYFSVWAGFIFGILGLGYTTEQLADKAVGAGPMLGLAAASIVVMIASSTNNFAVWETIYAMVIATLTLCIVIVFFALEKAGQGEGALQVVKMPLFALFAVLWMVLAGCATFIEPWIAPGNGYFGSWLGAVLACVVASSAYKSDTSTPTAGDKATPAP